MNGRGRTPTVVLHEYRADAGFVDIFSLLDIERNGNSVAAEIEQIVTRCTRSYGDRHHFPQNKRQRAIGSHLQ